MMISFDLCKYPGCPHLFFNVIFFSVGLFIYLPRSYARGMAPHGMMVVKHTNEHISVVFALLYGENLIEFFGRGQMSIICIGERLTRVYSPVFRGGHTLLRYAMFPCKIS